MSEQRIPVDGNARSTGRFGTRPTAPNGGYVQLNTFLCHERVNQQDDRLAVEDEQVRCEELEFRYSIVHPRHGLHDLFESWHRPQPIFGHGPQRLAQQQPRRAQPIHEEIGRLIRMIRFRSCSSTGADSIPLRFFIHGLGAIPRFWAHSCLPTHLFLVPGLRRAFGCLFVCRPGFRRSSFPKQPIRTS